jgi:hypothetical protein
MTYGNHQILQSTAPRRSASSTDCASLNGADQKLFADVVEKKYLPEDRADGCVDEYEQAAFAFKTLIDPHIDKTRAEKVLHNWMREVDAPRRRPSTR